jgi:hypothetical protein
MTKISSSTGMVALVQTSLMLPVALVSTPAGAIADMFSADRRAILRRRRSRRFARTSW